MEKYSGRFTNTDPTLDELVSRAFLTAHLLTADEKEAERATLEGIDSWNCDKEAGDGLFGKVLMAAARPISAIPVSVGERGRAWIHFPIELRSVLELPPVPRQCFVLHILLALPLCHCAHLLQMLPSEVAEGFMAACRRLSILESVRAGNG